LDVQLALARLATEISSAVEAAATQFEPSANSCMAISINFQLRSVMGAPGRAAGVGSAADTTSKPLARMKARMSSCVLSNSCSKWKRL